MNTAGRSNRRQFLRNAAAMALGPILTPFATTMGHAAFPDRPDEIASADLRLEGVKKYCLTMGSVATIQVFTEDRRLGHEAIAGGFSAMKSVDRLLSVFDPRSALSEINREAGKSAVPVQPDVLKILEHAAHFHRLTGGFFDPTIGPLLSLFGFFSDERRPVNPTDRVIAETFERVGFQNVDIDIPAGTAGLIREGSMIDLGGLGVGYAVDAAAAILRSYGIQSALIDHSGDIYAMGTPPGREAWEIGIRDPADQREVLTTVHLKDRAISTSGNYENFIRSGDERIGHILDPVSGRSASGYLSVSAIGATALEADALSTGFFAAGSERLPSGLLSSCGSEIVALLPGSGGDGPSTLQLIR